MPRMSCRILLSGLLAAAFLMIGGAKSWAQTETILHTFTNGTDGGNPYYQLAFDSKGNLYGAAQSGGTDGGGVVFELTPNSDGMWTQTILYNFTGFYGTGDGAFPTGGVTFDGKGNLYGVTSFGGTYSQGIVYELSPGSNGTWTETILYSFTGGVDGSGLFLAQGLALDSSGNLYGTTINGGTNGYGVVFEISPGSNGTWTETVLHSFTGGDDGSYPYARLIPMPRAISMEPASVAEPTTMACCMSWRRGRMVPGRKKPSIRLRASMAVPRLSPHSHSTRAEIFTLPDILSLLNLPATPMERLPRRISTNSSAVPLMGQTLPADSCSTQPATSMAPAPPAEHIWAQCGRLSPAQPECGPIAFCTASPAGMMGKIQFMARW